MMMTRRNFLAGSGAAAIGAGTMSMAGLAEAILAPRAMASTDVPWQASLGKSLETEHDYVVDVEGQLPDGLTGSLFRNGPGLFERGGIRKRNLLDGDGMIRAYDFADGKVRYRNRFVRTEKFLAEEERGEYAYSTWSTRSPGGMFSNIGGGTMLSQAGITAVHRNGDLLAFDEVGSPYALDPVTLETLGERHLVAGADAFIAKAHSKQDPKTGDWILVSTEFGREMTLGVLVLTKDGREKTRFVLPSPRQCYIHDFFATRDHIVFNLHPMMFGPLAFLSGASSFIDSLNWESDQGNLLVVVARDGTGEPKVMEAPSSYMWHSLNAWNDGGTIVADFVGYDAPDHFHQKDSLFRTIMDGKAGTAASPGTIRRWRIDLTAGRVAEEMVSTEAHEFPMIDPADAMKRHRTGYFATGAPGTWFHDGIVAQDYESGRRDEFHFGPTTYVTEPVYATGGDDTGYLLAEALDGGTGLGFLAVFRAAAIADGPVARLNLRHHLPLSFHGTWVDA